MTQAGGRRSEVGGQESEVGKPELFVVGLVSDTHGLLRPEIFSALEGVDLILHAGDVGGRSILDELSAIAPVRAV